MFGIGLANVLNPGACLLQQASKSLCYFYVWAHILLVRVVTLWFPVVNGVVWSMVSNKTAENKDQRRVWGGRHDMQGSCWTLLGSIADSSLHNEGNPQNPHMFGQTENTHTHTSHARHLCFISSEVAQERGWGMSDRRALHDTLFEPLIS